MSEEIRVRIRDFDVWEPGYDDGGPPDDGLCNTGSDDTDDSDDSDGSDGGDDGGSVSDQGSARPLKSEGTYDAEEPVYYGETWNVVVETINETGNRAAGTVGVTVDSEKDESHRMYIPAGTETFTFSNVGPIEKQSEDEVERDVCVGAFLELE